MRCSTVIYDHQFVCNSILATYSYIVHTVLAQQQCNRSGTGAGVSGSADRALAFSDLFMQITSIFKTLSRPQQHLNYLLTDSSWDSLET